MWPGGNDSWQKCASQWFCPGIVVFALQCWSGLVGGCHSHAPWCSIRPPHHTRSASQVDKKNTDVFGFGWDKLCTSNGMPRNVTYVEPPSRYLYPLFWKYCRCHIDIHCTYSHKSWHVAGKTIKDLAQSANQEILKAWPSARDPAHTSWRLRQSFS